MNSDKYVVCPHCGVIMKMAEARKQGDGKVWFQCKCGTIAPQFRVIDKNDDDFEYGALVPDEAMEAKLFSDYYEAEKRKTLQWRFKNLFHHKKLPEENVENNKKEQIISDTPSEELSIAENAPFLFATCPKCGKTFSAQEQIGNFIKCPQCGFESECLDDFGTDEQHHHGTVETIIKGKLKKQNALKWKIKFYVLKLFRLSKTEKLILHCPKCKSSFSSIKLDKELNDHKTRCPKCGYESEWIFPFITEEQYKQALEEERAFYRFMGVEMK